MEIIKNSTCVYCLKQISIDLFNKEHVFSRMFGNYENSYTLHEKQVCKSCNTYFSEYLEDKLALDSQLALLRIQQNKKPMSDGKKINTNRIKFSGTNDIFKGLDFIATTNKSNSERISLEVEPKIGLQLDIDSEDYTYFVPNLLPYNTPEINDILKNKMSPVNFWNISDDDVKNILNAKGYKPVQYMSTNDLTEIYPYHEIDLQLKCTIDSITKRFVAKIAFNYLVYTLGKELSLSKEFDFIRNFIRYGHNEEEFEFKFETIKLAFCTDITTSISNSNSHIVGLSWENKDFNSIWAIVSFYNENSYKIKLCNDISMMSKVLPLSIFDNKTNKIIDQNAVYILN